MVAMVLNLRSLLSVSEVLARLVSTQACISLSPVALPLKKHYYCLAGSVRRGKCCA